MKIYKVYIEYDFYVAAKNEDEALEIAYDNLEESIEAEKYDGAIKDIREVTDINKIPREWKNSIPFGSNDSDSTVEEILKKIIY